MVQLSPFKVRATFVNNKDYRGFVPGREYTLFIQQCEYNHIYVYDESKTKAFMCASLWFFFLYFSNVTLISEDEN